VAENKLLEKYATISQESKAKAKVMERRRKNATESKAKAKRISNVSSGTSQREGKGMYKVISVIGTRPQYIKIKPIYDFFEKQNDIKHLIIDTSQHFSYNVSGLLIDELKLNIYKRLDVENINEISFITSSILSLENIFEEEAPDFVLVYGDTNSTFCAALAAYKMGIPIGHVEAGVRGFTMIPEETNRVFVDQVSNIHYCSSSDDTRNVRNGIVTGDLEYELLNNLNPNIEPEDYMAMTIHRQSNMNVASLNKIFNFCSTLDCKIVFYQHHRTKIFMEKNNISAPANVAIEEPCSYLTMVKSMAECKGILTDSGSIHKTLPFFGKKALIFREEGIEWRSVDDAGFSKKFETNNDAEWLLSPAPDRDKLFFSGGVPASQLIYSKIMEFLNEHT
jgi:UDP-GlcNAc3NAcA epimerase